MKEIEQEYQDCKIAFIGKTKSGKSSLVKSLFGFDLHIDKQDESEEIALAMRIHNKDKKFGDIYDSFVVMDTPGFASFYEDDEFYIPFYQYVLSELDYLVWVVQGNTRSDRADQEMVLRLKPFIRPETKCILCVNMVDKIGGEYNKNWDNKTNMPNDVMNNLIVQRSYALQQKFDEINFQISDIVTCSVTKRFGIDNLFKIIIDKGER